MTMFPSTATSRQQTSWEKQIASQIIFLVIYTGCVIHTRSDCPKSILKTVSGIRDSHKWCFPHNFESTLTTTQCNQFFRKDICFSVCVGFKLPLPDTQGHKTESTKTELLTLALGRYMKTEPRRQKHPGSTINWSINKPLSVIVLFPTALHWCSLSLSHHFFGPRCAENAKIWNAKAARHHKRYWHALLPTLIHIQGNFALPCVFLSVSLGLLSSCLSPARLGVDW